MSTRSLTVVVKNKEIKVAQYCQTSGYPTVQGLIVLKFLLNSNLSLFSLNVDYLSTLEDVYSLIIEEQRNGNDIKHVNGIDIRYYISDITIDTGAKILYGILDGSIRRVKLDTKFANDSLSCEWCYLIDLDKMRFEIYKGFNKKKLSKNDRFYINDDDSPNGYYPVKKIKTYDLYNLPTINSFLERMKYYS